MSKILIDEATVKLALEALEFFKGLSLSMGEIERAEEAITTLKARLAEPAQQEPDVYGYASRLATHLWQKHYMKDAPQWKPFDDIIGVLTQIDNMTAGLTRIEQPAQQEPVISSGWVWVPVDPSWSMLVAGNHGQPGDFSAKKVWEDMIAALKRSFDYRRPVDPPNTSPPPQRKPLTDEQIDAAINAWFENEIVAGRQPFAKKMRAAIKAAHGIKENT